jgi:competence ComEA-like helix-hairpin-helix protein
MSDAFKKFVERREAEIKGRSAGRSWLWILIAIGCAVVLFLLVMRGNPNTGPVNPNTASLELISSLHGIGPEIAKGVIAGRPYTKADDLLKVPGIGPATLEKMKPRLKFD